MKYARHFVFLGCCLIPYTSLRFSFFGPGELFILVGFLFFLTNTSRPTILGGPLDVLLKFWILLFPVFIIGAVTNLSSSRLDAQVVQGVVFDSASYLFVFITMIVLNDHKFFGQVKPFNFFKNIILVYALSYTFLFILFLSRVSFFGWSLQYHMYFSPLVDNIHQAAMISSVLPFILLFIGNLEKKKSLSLLWYGGAFFCGWAAVASGSTKALWGLMAGCGVSVYFLVFPMKNPKLKKLVGVGVAFILIGLLVAVRLQDFADPAVSAFQEADDSRARAYIYSLSVERFFQSPLFGFGPGPQVDLGFGKRWDAHNTVLTLGLQSGLIGLGIALIFSIKFFFQSLSGSPALIGAIASFSVYFLGGDILRRLPIWVILAAIVYFSDQRLLGGKKNQRLPAAKGKIRSSDWQSMAN